MRHAITVTLVILFLAGCAKEKAEEDDTAPLAKAVPVERPAFTPLQPVQDATFAQDILNSPTPVFVDFNTSWCVPCKQMEPVLQELCSKYQGKIKFCSVDAEKNPAAANRYAVTTWPTYCIFVNGKVDTKIIGLKTKSELESLIAASHAI